MDASGEGNHLRVWKGRWTGDKTSAKTYSHRLLFNKSCLLISRPNSMNRSKVKLKDMLDWADATFELVRLWKDVVQQRYNFRSQIIADDKKT